MLMALAVPAFAGGKGAVKTDMVIHTDSGSYGTPGTVVGSAILNTTASGELIVVVNLDDAEPGIYGLRIWFGSAPSGFNYIVDTCLKVNAKGQGTANIKVDLPSEASEINVSLSVRPSFSPQLKPCYVNGPSWQNFVSVPLK